MRFRRFPLVSSTDHSTVPDPSIFKLLLIPWMLAPLGSFLMDPVKSLLSGLTHMDAPESQIIVKLSFGSIAALHATGCCSTTDSDSRPLHGQVVQGEGSCRVGSSAGCDLRFLCNVSVLCNVLVCTILGVLD